MLEGRLIDDVHALAPHVAGWDDLAVVRERPYSAPGWLLPWWEHAAPPDARFRVAVALERDAVVGVAPFFGATRAPGLEWLRPLGRGVSNRTEPLAAPGREAEVSHTLVGALAQARPAVLTLEAIDASSSWPPLLVRAWPGRLRPRVHRVSRSPAPIVRSPEDPRDWLATRSSRFRKHTRRVRRQLESEGAAFRRLSEVSDIQGRLGDLVRLHVARWKGRGGSDVMDTRVERMLMTSAEQLAPRSRLWMWVLEQEDVTISALLFVAAGGGVSYWLGGHDDRWAAHSPGVQTLVVGVEDAFERGAAWVDLGAGEQEYKVRMADDRAMLDYLTVAPRSRSYPAARAILALQEGAQAARRLASNRRSVPT